MISKSRYSYYSKYSKYDLIKNPELLTSIEVATDIACIGWVVKLGGADIVNKFADEKNFERIEQIILNINLASKDNPPLSMKEYYEKASKLLQY